MRPALFGLRAKVEERFATRMYFRLIDTQAGASTLNRSAVTPEVLDKLHPRFSLLFRWSQFIALDVILTLDYDSLYKIVQCDVSTPDPVNGLFTMRPSKGVLSSHVPLNLLRATLDHVCLRQNGTLYGNYVPMTERVRDERLFVEPDGSATTQDRYYENLFSSIKRANRK